MDDAKTEAQKKSLVVLLSSLMSHVDQMDIDTSTVLSSTIPAWMTTTLAKIKCSTEVVKSLILMYDVFFPS